MPPRRNVREACSQQVVKSLTVNPYEPIKFETLNPNLVNNINFRPPPYIGPSWSEHIASFSHRKFSLRDCEPGLMTLTKPNLHSTELNQRAKVIMFTITVWTHSALTANQLQQQLISRQLQKHN